MLTVFYFKITIGYRVTPIDTTPPPQSGGHILDYWSLQAYSLQCHHLQGWMDCLLYYIFLCFSLPFIPISDCYYFIIVNKTL